MGHNWLLLGYGFVCTSRCIFSHYRSVAFLRCLEARWGLLSKSKQVRSSFCYVAVGKNISFSLVFFLIFLNMYHTQKHVALLLHFSVSDRIGRVAPLVAALAPSPVICV